MNKVLKFSEFLNERYKFSFFSIGDHVKVSLGSNEYEKLHGKVGKIVDIDRKAKIIYIDFHEKFGEEGKYETWDLDGRLKDDTGLLFHDGGWLWSKIDGRFEPRNLQIINLDESLNEKTSGELLKPRRGKVLQFDHKKYPELATEFFELIQTAYAEIGGHSKILTPEDVFKDPDWNWWAGEDVHGSPDFDIVMFGKKTKFGVKYAGVGHDGSKEAKREYVDQRGKDLKQLGFYIEVSGKIAEILMNKYNVPVVTDQETVEKVLGKKVDWHGQNPEDPNATGNAWYGRTIGGHNHNKIMLGRPKA